MPEACVDVRPAHRRAHLPAGHAPGAGISLPGRRRHVAGGDGRLMVAPVLEIEGLRGGPAGMEIVKGVSVTVEHGQVHALMGPNGSGKSTLSHCIMGRPGFEVTGGTV